MKKRILGLAVIIGVILALSASAFAATSIYTPKFTTSKLSDATAGKTYSQNIVVEVGSSDAVWYIELESPTAAELEKYNLILNKAATESSHNGKIEIPKGTTKGTYVLYNKGNDPVYRDTKSLALKFKATNGGQSVEKEYKLKIVGTAPAFTSPSDADLGKTFFTSNNATEDWNKSGVGVVGRAFPTGDKAIKIQAGTGTLPIKMTATGLVNGLTATQTYGSTDKNVTDARGATTHTGSNIPAMTITGTPTKAGKMSVKVTAANETKSANGTYTLTILDSPDITTAKLTDATYGKAYSATLAGKGGDKTYPLAWFATGLPTGLTITSKDGKISGTISKDAVIFKAGSADATYNVTFSAVSYADKDYPKSEAQTVVAKKTLPLKVKANKPVFISADTFKGNTLVLSASQTLTQSLAKSDNSNFAPVVNGSNMFIYVDTAAKFSVKGLPAGWTVTTGQVVSTDTSDATDLKKGRGSYVTFTGAGLKATTPVKSGKIEITATNGAGSTKLTIPYKVDAAKPKLTAKPATNTSTVNNADYLNKGNSAVLIGTGTTSKKLNTEINALLTATPGPIKWKAVKLPKGLTLKASGDTQATLTGKFTKEQEPTEWSITATNSVTSYTAVVSGEIAIYTSPDIKTKKLGKATAGKHYTAKVDVKGTDAVFTEAKLKMVGVNDTDIFGPAKKNADIKSGSTIYGHISFLSDDKGKCFISADFTRIPPSIAVYMKAANPAGLPDEVTLSIDVAGVKPKITTSKVYDGTNGAKLSNSSNTDVVASIDVTGTDPMSYRAYVASKDAEKLGLTSSGWLRFTDNGNYAGGVTNGNGYKFESKDTDAGMTIVVKAKPDMAAKGLPITVEVTNPAADGKWTKKVYKIDVTGKGVGWKYAKATGPTKAAENNYTNLPSASKDITVYGTAGQENTAFVILAMSGDKPWQVTTKPTSGDTTEKGAVNGIRVKGTGSTVTIYGTPTAGKETKTKIPVTLTNPLTKAKRAVNVNVIAYMPPIINSKDTKVKYGDYDTYEEKSLAGYACVELGKKVNIKLSTKAGSKTGLSWDITKADGVKGVTDKSTFLSVLGLTFDREKGTITGTPKVTTSNDSSGYYFSPANVTVQAANVAGKSAEGKVLIFVKGKKFKIDTKNSKLKIYNTASNNANVGQIITSLNDEKISKDIVFKLQENAELPEGVKLENDGKITVEANTPASKGETIKFQADNVGTVVKGSVKVVIYDPAPIVTLSNNGTVSLTASSADKDEKTLTATASNVTGDTKITWKVQRPDGVDSKIKVAVKADTSDKSGKSATVTVTLPKNYNGDAASDKVFKIVATNSLSKEVGLAELTLSATTLKAALPENKSALPEDEELTEEAEETTEEAAEETEEVKAEASITFGEARTEASLTAGQRAAIEEEGYIIAAVLPEMSVTESRQYDIEAELSEKAPEGAKLVWFAFPKDVEPSDDDKIADFFDEEGAEIDAVPASRKIVVSPWLEAEITYAPVIVVKAEDTAGAKDTLEGAEAGDVVTEEALAEAEAVSPDETAPAAE